eukprot:GFYU01005243.1.p1 GENE.GFYU01005243.1~~GFYU01005243.1.p1  ORF type:complete len:370 (-),score=78.98 GFYU01005243.1:129-1238(-)
MTVHNGLREDECPICRNEQSHTIGMVLMISSCSHKICKKCVDNMFMVDGVEQKTIKCPVCRTVLHKTYFVENIPYDKTLSREADIRRRNAATFNLKESDFDSLAEYNKYLEFVEDITYNLTNKIDLDKTTKDLNKFKAEHHETIILNRSRRADEQKQLQARLKAEEQSRLDRVAHYKEQDELEKQRRLEEREERMSALESGRAVKAKKKAKAAAPKAAPVVDSAGSKQGAKLKLKLKMGQEEGGATSSGGFKIRVKRERTSDDENENEPKAKQMKVEVKAEPNMSYVPQAPVAFTPSQQDQQQQQQQMAQFALPVPKATQPKRPDPATMGPAEVRSFVATQCRAGGELPDQNSRRFEYEFYGSLLATKV